MADNWYIVLELEFDPPVEDEAEISKRIEEKARFWSTKSQDFRMGKQYQVWHQSLNQIKKDMIGPDNRRRELAKAACEEAYGPIDKLLKLMGRKGEITKDEAEKMAAKQKVPVERVFRRMKKLGIRLSEGKEADHQAVYEKYYKSKPKDSAAFDTVKPLLDTMNLADLYEFLADGTANQAKSLKNMPCANLVSMAQEKKSQYIKSDAVSSAGKKLCGHCETIFSSDAGKRNYDEYLEYMKRKEILDYAKSTAEIRGEMDADMAEEHIASLAGVVRDRKLAEQILEAFCRTEKIAYTKGGAVQANKNIKTCRCGCMNDVSGGRKICSNCGLDLMIKCPSCGKFSDNNIKVCTCGFNFENIDRAMALCDSAQAGIDALDLKIAAINLSDAEKYWPGSPRAAALRKRLDDCQERIGKEIDKMQSAVKAKRFFEAREQYGVIKKLFSGYSDKNTEELIESSIKSAKATLDRARAAADDTQRLELCSKAYELCSDLPGVKELMPPPPKVKGLKVVTDPKARLNSLSWTNSGDRSVVYNVVRSRSVNVRAMSDGDNIYRGSAASFADKDIEAGVTYYYNVFAERAGLFSAGAEGDTDAAVNLFEIKGLSASPGEGSAELSWSKLPNGVTAEVYSVDGGKETLLRSCSGVSFLVSGLENDRMYRWHVKLAYMINGSRPFRAARRCP